MQKIQLYYLLELEVILGGETFNNLFLICAIIGTGVFVLKTFLPIDSGTEIGSDFTGITDTDASFSLFTIESISAFFMCFGWMGWAAKDYLHYDMKITLVIAVVSGVVGMLFFSWLITQIKKLEHTPKKDINELVGKSGKAYLTMPPKGTGKISIEFGGALEELNARNNTDEEIKSFEPIKVVKIENGEIFVEKDM